MSDASSSRKFNRCIIDEKEIFMSWYEEVAYKIGYIEAHDLVKLSDSLGKVIDHQLAQKGLMRSTPMGLIRALKIDLVYLFTRHQCHINSSIFFDLAMDFVQSEYQLANSVGEDILANAIAKAQPNLQQLTASELNRIDQDFVTKLFTLCLMAKDDHTLRMEIGFGGNVIKLLRQALEFDDSNSQVKVFSSELLRQFVTVIDSLQEEMSTHPQIASLYKLKLVLNSNIYHQDDVLKLQQLDASLQALLAIGPKGIKKKVLAEIYSEKALAKHLSFNRMLRRIEQNGLVYEQIANRQPLVYLSHQGLKLIGPELATEFLKHANKELSGICQLPEIVQSEILKTVSYTETDYLRFLYKNGTKLSPRAVSVIAKQLLSGDYANKVVDVLLNLLHNKENLWMRAEICRLLSEVDKTAIVIKAMEGLALKDPSPKVRQIAREYLSV